MAATRALNFNYKNANNGQRIFPYRDWMSDDGYGLFFGTHGTTPANYTFIKPSSPELLLFGYGTDGTGDATTGVMGISVTGGNALFYTNAAFAAGTVSLPAINFGNASGDTNTGIYRVAADQIGFSCAGANVMTIAAGTVTLASNTAVAFSGTGATTTRNNLGLLAAVKSTDEARSSNTTLTNDSALTATVQSGKTYQFECQVRFTMASTTPGVGFAINAPTNSLYNYKYTQTRGSVFDGTNEVTSSATITYIESVTSVDILIRGVITTTASGTLALAWRQSNTSADAVTSKAGAYLRVREVV